MDAFLRRVVAQRELEQERDILEASLEHSCRVCGKHIAGDDLALTVCHRCGGRRQQARLEREDKEREFTLRCQRWALSVAGFTATKGLTMSDETRLCSAGCGRQLRSHNKSGTCSPCTKGKVGGVVSISAAGLKVSNARKDFRTVASALGFNPDQLEDDFRQGWLSTVRASVQRRVENDQLDSVHVEVSS